MRCEDEVAAHHRVAAVLANTGEDAPPHLWDRIAARAERLDAGQPPLVPTAHRAAPRPPRPWRLVPIAAAVAAVVAAVVIAVLGDKVGRLDHRVNQLSAASRSQGRAEVAQSALADPHARRVVLSAAQPGGKPRGDIVILPSGAAYLLDSTLPPLPPDHTYQLWQMDHGVAVSVSVLGRDPSTVAFSVDPASPAGVFAVTVEPAGGAVTPTKAPVAQSS